MKRKTVREHILEHISENIGVRLDNVRRGVGSVADKELVDEALGFRSLCLFSAADDESLKRAWDNSNLEYSL
jgi:hypothetical protein